MQKYTFSGSEFHTFSITMRSNAGVARLMHRVSTRPRI